MPIALKPELASSGISGSTDVVLIVNQPWVGVPVGTQVWIAAGHTDMRKGFNGFSMSHGSSANQHAKNVWSLNALVRTAARCSM
jgi:hypothetical protein